MTDEKDKSASQEVRGELVRRLSPAPVRVLAIISGLVLIRGLIALISRYCLVFRRQATVEIQGSSLILDAEWSILGKRFRKTRTVAKIVDITGIHFENRQRYIYMIVGFGALALGTWIGIQWFVDGLRAGYPYRALVGAGIVLLGILIDLGLYLFFPQGPGSARLALEMGPWRMRLSGVDHDAASRFLDMVRQSWESQAR